jgi:glycosyltransferase involved in cell wall biosynthesis
VPTFSVVIPAYQAADTIGDAIESVLVQTVVPLELIVVDDGSTDDIEAALASYRDRISLISKENGGRASALNLGVGHASGEYVSFLDADDAYDPARIESLGMLASERPDLDVLATDARLELGGRIVGRFSAQTPFAVEDQRTAILDRCFIVCPCVRRKSFVEVGGFNDALRLAQDWDCWIRLIMHGARVGLVDEPFYRYRLRMKTDAGWRSASLRSRANVLEQARETYDLTPAERTVLDRSVATSRRRALFAEAEAALRSGDRSARRRSLAIAFGRHFGLVTRMKALGAAIAPRAAGRRLERMEAETGWSRSQQAYPRG